MGIRETLNRNPSITTGVTIGIIVLAIIVIVYQLWPASGGSMPPPKAFYTIDDGATWFEDSAEKIPPFIKDGKEAVRAYVYVCDDGTKFVGYMERYNKEGKAKLEKIMADAGPGRYPAERFEVDDNYKEYKKPGARYKWVTSRSPAFQSTLEVRCKNGTYPRPLVAGVPE